jgi:HD-GYP domain-containing protein (c-di-GMP phosphodiesterase class II)
MEQNNLEQRLKDSFRELEISSEIQSKFMPYLDLLRLKDEATWAHSVRVGFLGKEIAQYKHDDPHALFLPGIVHDVGKLLIDSNTLKKKQGFNQDDKKLMDEHPIYGYQLLEGVAPFSALVSYYHHYFGERGYPRNRPLPAVNVAFSEDTLHYAKECSRIVSIADFWDALTTRENDKFSPGKPRLPTREEAIGIILGNSGCRKYLVKKLYDDGVLK